MLLGTVPKASKSQWTHCTSLHCQPLSICPAFFAQKRPQHRKVQENPPTRVGVLSSLILCSIQNLVQNPKSEIQNPKSSPKIQNSDHRGPHKKNCYITIQNPKSKIQNPEIRPKKFGFWILDSDFGFRILDFGGVQGIPPGPPTVSDRAGGRKKTRQQRREREGAKTTFVGNIFQGFCCSWA